ncbi:hypothetical protein B0H17DRAFT_1213603 [Mycena rosella]|uniref:Uncharacterized protein n=1 Tax=Mycena rosella TaxID=1033263 RepID=A0AAD7CPU0_MYCRO|nr:hypothetical protein B0H17DRAFT_1213603 [Mycena rosella]
MAYMQEAHFDDEDGCVREKPGRNPVATQFFLEELDPAAEVYRKCNAKAGRLNLFYNALTLKEHARYVNTGVAFPLAEFAFDKKYEDWKTMGKKKFMFVYGNDVLEEYDIPTAEEINGIPDSDVDDDEEVEINLEDTDDDEDEEIDVDAELNSED